MVITLGKDAPSYNMVKKWDAEFKRGGGRPGRTVVIMADRRVTECCTELGIPQERIHAVIHNEFQMSKVSTRWVQKLLGPVLKRTRLNMSRENLAIFEADPNSFLRRFVTMDETWVHHFQPETKQHRSSGNTQVLRLPRKPKL
ncbi:uncharacterized protein LOC121383583 [Gigantopelta aegis]|uniref:uncharacterized protein LOC121383583 n=1 Tax=Gigantopelta aegis TaxID=1735272 RepID=UPI001B88AB5E|nr:uncharacterized protein LOC121383583 [Gigantopelta aegis]